MANVFPEEFEALVQEYLSDGILTDKERQVLLKKAEKMGLDVEEVDVYLDSKVTKIKMDDTAAAQRLKGKTCPHCGASVQDFVDKCPECGQPITAEASAEVKEIIDNLEEALVQLKSGEDYRKHKANVERYVRKADMYYSSNPKIQKLLAEVKIESEAAEKAAKSRALKNTITNFISKHKLLSAIIVLVVIGGIISLVDALKGPNPADDPAACIEAVNQAIQENDVTKAEALLKKYDRSHSYSSIDPAVNLVIDYYLEKGDISKADAWNEDAWIRDSKNTYGKKIGAAYLEIGEYERAQKLISGNSGIYTSDAPTYIKIIKAMKKNGESSEDIEAYIEGLVSGLRNSEDKADLRATLTKAAGIH